LGYSDFFPAALTLAQRAFAAADIFALAAALIFLFFMGALTDFETGFVFTLAQRAVCAAEILARPAALILPLALIGDCEEVPRIETSSWSKSSILSLRSAARRSWVDVNDDN